jgi:methylmalonyl-CoA mutase C-terminal domain/subunit
VLVAKVGLDGHDRGAKVIARVLRDAGHEVIYLGRRQSVEAVARAARDEDVDVVGLSVLSGTHHDNVRELVAALRAENISPRLVVGGTILRREIPSLQAAGVDAVFPVGTTIEAVQAYFSGVAEEVR